MLEAQQKYNVREKLISTTAEFDEFFDSGFVTAFLDTVGSYLAIVSPSFNQIGEWGPKQADQVSKSAELHSGLCMGVSFVLSILDEDTGARLARVMQTEHRAAVCILGMQHNGPFSRMRFCTPRFEALWHCMHTTLRQLYLTGNIVLRVTPPKRVTAEFLLQRVGDDSRFFLEYIRLLVVSTFMTTETKKLYLADQIRMLTEVREMISTNCCHRKLKSHIRAKELQEKHNADPRDSQILKDMRRLDIETASAEAQQKTLVGLGFGSIYTQIAVGDVFAVDNESASTNAHSSIDGLSHFVTVDSAAMFSSLSAPDEDTLEKARVFTTALYGDCTLNSIGISVQRYGLSCKDDLCSPSTDYTVPILDEILLFMEVYGDECLGDEQITMLDNPTDTELNKCIKFRIDGKVEWIEYDPSDMKLHPGKPRAWTKKMCSVFTEEITRRLQDLGIGIQGLHVNGSLLEEKDGCIYPSTSLTFMAASYVTGKSVIANLGEAVKLVSHPNYILVEHERFKFPAVDLVACSSSSSDDEEAGCTPPLHVEKENPGDEDNEPVTKLEILQAVDHLVKIRESERAQRLGMQHVLSVPMSPLQIQQSIFELGEDNTSFISTESVDKEGRVGGARVEGGERRRRGERGGRGRSKKKKV
jgi:hypothetical protein